jgi:magnesium chelatase subunit I
MQNLKTLGELKASNYISRTIKEELRSNLIAKIKANEPVFEGIIGYENTVELQLKRAILAQHNINLLGLRGQAKTRLARLMVNLLDEYIPFVSGSEINDDPLNPLSRYAKDIIAELGDKTPISWLHRNDRFSEKLATPDVTVADLIGDVDPIKASNLKLSYADDRVIHYGMIPRANRCIFVINELPDLQARIQVSLFNILQEGDLQIRGYKLRLPLDIQFVFTANPEDYTNRGSIVTPLKDRIGSQILTHYPADIETAKLITKQEAKSLPNIDMPEMAYDLIETIGFEARNSHYIDSKSGVSARMSITALESLYSTAELRMLSGGQKKAVVRLSDFAGVVPAITGKVELVYEGEQEGAQEVAMMLISDASKTLFIKYFPRIQKIQQEENKGPYAAIVNWFAQNAELELLDTANDKEYRKALDSIKPLHDLVVKYAPEFIGTPQEYFVKELVLWGLVAYKKLNRERYSEGYQFKDIVGNILSNLGQ